MKKLSLNAKFITTSLFCLALLAVPALAVQGQALYYAAPQPRPQVPGVMSDEVRLDPLAGALYRYGVQGGSSTPQSYDITKDVFTVIRGKLRQAAARSLLTDDQLTYLLAQLDAGADTNPFQQSLTEGEPNNKRCTGKRYSASFWKVAGGSVRGRSARSCGEKASAWAKSASGR